MNISRVLSILAFLVLVSSGSSVRAQEADAPWIFFDLGDTLLGTENDPASGDLTRLWWTRFEDEDGTITDARAYLMKLKAMGFRIGLIVNIPESWGDPTLQRAREWLAEPSPARRRQLAAELTTIKMQTVAGYFEGHGPGDTFRQRPRWQDAEHRAMDWSVFTPGGLLVSFFDENRKPDEGPYTTDEQLMLFHQAVEIARRTGSAAIYQGENHHEIEAARAAGLIARRVDFEPGADIQRRGFFLSPDEIRKLQ